MSMSQQRCFNTTLFQGCGSNVENERKSDLGISTLPNFATTSEPKVEI